MKRVFLVEDGLSFVGGLSFVIKEWGYELEITRIRLETGALWINGNYDLMTLDVSPPDGSGCDLCRCIRQTSTVSVMFLTAADEETDITTGLDIGGDDYIIKPFKLVVFLSRINALLRRSNHFNQPVIKLTSNGIIVDRLKDEIYKNGQLPGLTIGEYKLLCLFMGRPDTALSLEQIPSRPWDCNSNCIDSNTLTVYIRRLRTKIENHPGDPKRIVTVRCMGYKWNPVD